MLRSNTASDEKPTDDRAQLNRSRLTVNWFVKRLLLAGFATCIAILIAEVALRLFVEQELRRSAIYDRDLGWRGRPHASGLYIRRQDGIRTRFRYNNIGYRDEDVFARRDGDPEIRVMLLGDSFLENLEVNYEDVFHKKLEDRLNDSSPPAFSAVAVGSQGYSTAQELLAFRRFKDTVEPNIVVTVFYTGNDFEDNGRRRFAYLAEDNSVVLPRNTESHLKFQIQALKRWAYESSDLVYLVKNQLQRIIEIDLKDASKKTDDVSQQELQQLTFALLRQIHEEAAADGARHGIIIIPSRDELVANNLTRSEDVAGFCELQKIPYLNLAKCLNPEDYFEVDVHFTVDGHEKVANEIAYYLRSEFADIVEPCFSADVIAKCDEAHRSK